MSDLLPPVTTCQNCGAEAGRNFCPECGQDSRDHTVSVRLLVQDFASDVFTYDSRFFRSFIPLILRPGALTVEYTRGRRVRYIPPLRLYVFVSILFFFVVSVKVNGQLREQGWFDRDRTAAADSATVAAVLDLLPAVPDSLPAGQDPASWIASRLAAASPPDSILALGDWSSGGVETAGSTRSWSVGSQDDGFDERTFVNAIQKLVPKFVFLLLPLFALLLALIYVRSRRRFIEHLVLSLHLHAFVFLLFTVALLTRSGWAALAVYLAIHAYIYLALRRVYAQGWLKTSVKFFLLTGSYNVILMTLVVIAVVSTAKLVEMSNDHPTLVLWLLG